MSKRGLQQQLEVIEQDRDKPAIAFFDLDRTLIAGYSIVGMARERIRHGLTRGDLRDSVAILRDLAKQQRTMKQGLKGSDYNRLVKTLSRSLKGISEETLSHLGEQAYHNTIARSLYSEAITLLEAHRRAGHRVAIVTAATRYQVDPIAKVLGADEVCCTRPGSRGRQIYREHTRTLVLRGGQSNSGAARVQATGVFPEEQLVLLGFYRRPAAAEQGWKTRCCKSLRKTGRLCRHTLLAATQLCKPRHTVAGNRASHHAHAADGGHNYRVVCTGRTDKRAWPWQPHEPQAHHTNGG